MTWWYRVGLTLLLTLSEARSVGAQLSGYASFGEYQMPRDAEISLARSAAPDNVSRRATVKVLTDSGYTVAVEGTNGFVCIVMRSWAAATFTPGRVRDFVYYSKLRAPICFDPVASRTILPLQERRTALGMQGKDAETISRDIATDYAAGRLPKLEGVAFAYMWSAGQDLGSGVGAFHPHMMVFAPYYDNAMVGGNRLGGHQPFVLEDAGTPFAVVAIPVDGNPAIKPVASGQSPPQP
jgi:hypothetical protein